MLQIGAHRDLAMLCTGPLFLPGHMHRLLVTLNQYPFTTTFPLHERRTDPWLNVNFYMNPQHLIH